MENYYREKVLENEIKKDQSLNHKLSYNRYKTTDDRGYDIINFGNNFENYKNTLKVKEVDEWNAIVKKAGGNETFSKKDIYQSPYDHSDTEKIAHQFKLNRKSNYYYMLNINFHLEYIESLPKISEDPTYNRLSMSKIKPKSILENNHNFNTNHSTGNLNNSGHPLSKSLNIEKNQWFKERKDITSENHSKVRNI